MKKINLVLMAAICGMAMGFGSCSEQVMNNDMPAEEGRTGLLRIQTRAGEEGVDDGRLYILNEEGNCIHLFTLDAANPLVSANLAQGTYDVYALGGDDLDVFSLPGKETEADKRFIALTQNQVMGDLQWGHQTVEIVNGESKSLELSLERKVFLIEEVKINEVPEEVTAIEVSMMPMHSRLQLDGEYTADLTKVIVNLKSQGGGTWKSTGAVYSFPSIGRAVVTISMTFGEEVKHYSYVTESTGIPANVKVHIDATYSRTWENKLDISLKCADWGEQKDIQFTFDNGYEGTMYQGSSTEEPTVGQTYGGYYVVSVDEANRKAVLVRKSQDNNYILNDSINAKLAKGIKKPQIDNVTPIGEWRLPTPEECSVFALDPTLPNRIFDHGYYCLDGNAIKSYDIDVVDGKIVNTGLTEGLSADTWLRPVIEITY